MTKKDLYDQWNTKTLGGSTKLSVDNFDLIQEPVHVEAPNESSLELVNLVGQATNTQSQSGPIPGTGAVVSVTDTVGTGSPVSILLAPGEGEAYEISGGMWTEDNCNAIYLRIYDGDGATFTDIDYKTSVGILEITTGGNFKIVYPQTLRIMYGTATGDNTTNIAYCRVR